MKKIILLIFVLSFNAFAKEGKKDKKVLDFSSIKDVLKKDGLEEEAKKRLAKEREVQEKKLSRKKSRYNLPQEKEFWSFLSEYWLVKNAPVIKWDFRRPDYGIEKSFREFLERMGLYEIKFKILMVNTPNIYHFALPSNPDEYIFLLSVPFMRTLDLSKLEISLLLYEDLLRIKQGYFKKFVQNKDMDKLFGKNYYGKKLNDKILTNYLKKYDEIVYDKGFNFQQQYAVTKLIDQSLKNDLKLWKTYYGLLQRIDGLVKTNVLYREYNKIYRSAELQLGWLNPTKK